MKTSLDHLPEGKRAELARVVEIVRDGFAFATERRTVPRLREAALLKIVLFGSYARGDWVEDPVGRYFSDYDLLVVVSSEELTEVAEFWERTEAQLLADLAEGTRLRTPVSLIYHSLDDVNEKLRLGRYFFTDILRDGIVLFEEPGHPFTEPRPLSAAQALQETRDYYEDWFTSADEFFDNFQFNLEQQRFNNAAFQLHQATERFYHCLFLVRTLYSPKTHNLGRLRLMAEKLEPRVRTVWPTATKDEKRCWQLLREAYVKARYSRHYRISDEQLAWLGSRVAVLRDIIATVSAERLATLEEAA